MKHFRKGLEQLKTVFCYARTDNLGPIQIVRPKYETVASATQDDWPNPEIHFLSPLSGLLFLLKGTKKQIKSFVKVTMCTARISQELLDNARATNKQKIGSTVGVNPSLTPVHTPVHTQPYNTGPLCKLTQAYEVLCFQCKLPSVLVIIHSCLTHEASVDVFLLGEVAGCEASIHVHVRTILPVGQTLERYLYNRRTREHI